MWNDSINSLGIQVSESMFVPEKHNAVCWRFSIRTSSSSAKPLIFIANPVVNLIWEVKQVSEAWHERRHLMLYDRTLNLAIARHHRRTGWVALFGSNHKPDVVCLGVADLLRVPKSDILPSRSSTVMGACYSSTSSLQQKLTTWSLL